MFEVTYKMNNMRVSLVTFAFIGENFVLMLQIRAHRASVNFMI